MHLLKNTNFYFFQVAIHKLYCQTKRKIIRKNKNTLESIENDVKLNKSSMKGRKTVTCKLSIRQSFNEQKIILEKIDGDYEDLNKFSNAAQQKNKVTCLQNTQIDNYHNKILTYFLDKARQKFLKI